MPGTAHSSSPGCGDYTPGNAQKSRSHPRQRRRRRLSHRATERFRIPGGDAGAGSCNTILYTARAASVTCPASLRGRPQSSLRSIIKSVPTALGGRLRRTRPATATTVST